MKESNYKWVVVALLANVGALNYCDRAAISAVFPLLRTDLQISDLELAAVGSFFLWTYALASPLSGVLADRMSRSRLILISLVGWSAVTLVTGFVTTVPQLLATRVLLGFFEAAYLPAAIALIADHHSPRTRGTASAIHTAGLNIGLVAGGVGSGWMGHHFGWKTGFIILGVVGLALGVVVHFVLRDATPAKADSTPRPAAHGALAGFVALSRVPSFVLIIVACMIGAVGSNIFINWLPLYFNEKFHLGLASSGFFGTFALQSAGAIAVIAGGIFSDRVSAGRPERRMLIEGAASFLATPFLFVFLFPDPRLLAVNVGIFMFSFCQKFGYSSVMPLICDLLPPRLRSTAFGVNNAANCLVGGIGVIITVYLKATWGLSLVFAAISALTLLTAIIIVIGYVVFVRRDLARRAADIKAEEEAELAGRQPASA